MVSFATCQLLDPCVTLIPTAVQVRGSMITRYVVIISTNQETVSLDEQKANQFECTLSHYIIDNNTARAISRFLSNPNDTRQCEQGTRGSHLALSFSQIY